MTFQRKVKASKTITTEGICTTLKHNSTWIVCFNYLCHDWAEYLLKRGIINTFTERYVNRVIFPRALPNIFQISSAREKEISIFVKRYCHYSISEIKCFFDTISVMNVNVNIKYTSVALQQL
eukprot:c26831_g1_i1.p2 GENE.c26831_g1_i1~~c26831_g1_i1.p2  ORF type:complete len:122 (+),score=4.43 c26831_g1_i1:97-462(+)